MTKAPDDWKPLRLAGLMAHIGPMLARRRDQGWSYGLQTGDQHANMIGLVHGGAYASLADHAMSMLAWESVGRQPVVTIDLATRFIASARPGDFLEITPHLTARSGSLLFVEAGMTCRDRLLARFSGIWKHVAPSGQETNHDA